MMPSRAHHEVMTGPGPDTPPGWSYNPSDWMQRGPIIAMAFVGFFLSRYLAAYQSGHITYPWDPFFGDGTRRVLDSDVSVAAAPWLVHGTTDASRWNDVVVGIAVVILSLPRGRIQQQFGDWNRYLVW
jgi:SPW repeat